MQVEQHGEHVIITLPKMVVIYEGAEEFKQMLYDLCEQGHQNIVLDFSHVIMIDTAGISPLLVSQKRLRDIGGRLRISNITSNYIREMFKTIELHKVIQLDENASA